VRDTLTNTHRTRQPKQLKKIVFSVDKNFLCLKYTQNQAKKAAQLKIINSRRGDLTPSQMPGMGAREGQHP
jgi:hypothetical protein